MKTLIKKIDEFLFKKFIKIEKSRRIVISAVILGSLMLFSTFFFFDKFYIFIPILIVVTYFLTYFSLLEGIEKIEWLLLFIIPVVFTVVSYLFFFLFPSRWLTRLPFITIYVISIYAILRTSNIFNVGVEKSLQLYRAAFSVNFFYQTLIIFFFANFYLSLKLNPILNGLGIMIMSFILAFHLFWVIKLELVFEKLTLLYTILLCLIMAEIGCMLSFYTLEIPVFALVITASYYGLAGLTYAYLDQRLFKETIREYLFVIIFVYLVAFLTSIRW